MECFDRSSLFGCHGDGRNFYVAILQNHLIDNRFNSMPIAGKGNQLFRLPLELLLW
jgi:hypothetical protein